jgi:hypothetical protein
MFLVNSYLLTAKDASLLDHGSLGRQPLCHESLAAEVQELRSRSRSSRITGGASSEDAEYDDEEEPEVVKLIVTDDFKHDVLVKNLGLSGHKSASDLSGSVQQMAADKVMGMLGLHAPGNGSTLGSIGAGAPEVRLVVIIVL